MCSCFFFFLSPFFALTVKLVVVYNLWFCLKFYIHKYQSFFDLKIMPMFIWSAFSHQWISQLEFLLTVNVVTAMKLKKKDLIGHSIFTLKLSSHKLLPEKTRLITILLRLSSFDPNSNQCFQKSNLFHCKYNWAGFQEKQGFKMGEGFSVHVVLSLCFVE